METERHIIREIIEPVADKDVQSHGTYDYEQHPQWEWAVNTFNVLRALIGNLSALRSVIFPQKHL